MGWGGGVFGVPSVLLGFSPQAIYKLKQACRVEVEAGQQGQLLTPEEVVDRIFLLVDENGDGNGGGDGGPLHSSPPSWQGDLGRSFHLSATGVFTCEITKGVPSAWHL